ncbi:hypothetical protein QQF64_029290 [Cirrhinus molitorella]|uniref:Uncharacterized protein n=1 Tax=Cirrhinus molitorella TaxID=172907 RepID=A0ABR3N9E9_9TELE
MTNRLCEMGLDKQTKHPAVAGSVTARRFLQRFPSGQCVRGYNPSRFEENSPNVFGLLWWKCHLSALGYWRRKKLLHVCVCVRI